MTSLPVYVTLMAAFLFCRETDAENFKVTSTKEKAPRFRFRRSLPTAAEAQLVLDTHNEMRATIGDEGDEPIPANMRYMTWDEGLAINSLTYAKKCLWKHSPVESRRTPILNEINGENLWAGTGELKTNFDPVRGVRAWFNEYEYYEFYNQTCVPGKKCGHYTQVVWATTYKLGCAWTICPILTTPSTFLNDAMYFVCQYGPSGNIEGTKLYKVGPRCSQCDPDDTCQDGLCRNAERDKNIPVTSNAGTIAGILVGVVVVLTVLGVAGFYLYNKYQVQANALLAWRKRRRVSSAVNLKDSSVDVSQENNNEIKADDKYNSTKKQPRGTRLESVQIDTSNLPD